MKEQPKLFETPEDRVLGPNKTSLVKAIKELQRELKIRTSVYPRWIAQGKISEEIAQFRINCFVDVITHLNELLDCLQATNQGSRND